MQKYMARRGLWVPWMGVIFKGSFGKVGSRTTREADSRDDGFADPLGCRWGVSWANQNIRIVSLSASALCARHGEFGGQQRRWGKFIRMMGNADVAFTQEVHGRGRRRERIE